MYWAQYRVSENNWVDILGSNFPDRCFEHADWYAKQFNVETRVIKRGDVVVERKVNYEIQGG